MSEEVKKPKFCPACVSIKPEMSLCRSWAVAWLVIMPLTMLFSAWYDRKSPNWNVVGNLFIPAILAVTWLCTLWAYFISVILGRRYFIWLDTVVGHLHVHRMNWWQEFLRDEQTATTPLPKGPVFEIWIGGWFRHSKVLNDDKNFGWKIRVTGRWFSCLPKYLVLTSMHDHDRSHSVWLTFSCFVKNRELDYECLFRALKLVDANKSVITALYELERRRANDEAPAVAGHVGADVS